jgi:hypothetical protein
MEFLALLTRWLIFPVGPLLLFFVVAGVVSRHGRRKIQQELEPLADMFGLRPLVARPGLFRVGNAGLVGRLEGQEVRLTISPKVQRHRYEDPSWGVHLRLRVTPSLSAEFSATREGTTGRLLQRFIPEEKVGDGDVDELLHIRSLGAGDREVLRLQPVQNGLFRLVTLGSFEFKGGELHLQATTQDDWSDLAEEVLKNARNFAHALAHDAVPTHHDGVWSV